MTGLPNSLAARDIASLIHPYTNLEKHKTDGPGHHGPRRGGLCL